MATAFTVTAHGPVAAGAFGWTYGGERHVTVVVKAAFSVGGGLQPAEAIASAAERAEGWGHDHLLSARDRVPYRGAVDVLVTGHGRTPGDRPAEWLRVRLEARRGGAALLDKELVVVAPRGRDGHARPFAHVPLDWAHALPGAGDDANPESRPGDEPRIRYPSAPDRVAGFGPMGPAFPARRRLLGGLDPRALESDAPDLPASFDWSYFQVAPADQRLPRLHGDERFAVHGVHPRGAVELVLPSMQARARLRCRGVERAFALVPDTLHIDVDRGGYTLAWRGSLVVADAGPWEVVAWLEPAAAQPRPSPVADPESSAAYDALVTAITAQADDAAPDSGDAETRPVRALQPPAAAPASTTPATKRRRRDELAYTAIATGGPADEPLPFRPGQVVLPAPSSSPPRRRDELGGTVFAAPTPTATPLPFPRQPRVRALMTTAAADDGPKAAPLPFRPGVPGAPPPAMPEHHDEPPDSTGTRPMEPLDHAKVLAAATTPFGRPGAPEAAARRKGPLAATVVADGPRGEPLPFRPGAPGASAPQFPPYEEEPPDSTGTRPLGALDASSVGPALPFGPTPPAPARLDLPTGAPRGAPASAPPAAPPAMPERPSLLAPRPAAPPPARPKTGLAALEPVALEGGDDLPEP